MTCGRRRAVPRPRASRDDGDGARRDGPAVARDGRAERPGVNPLIKSVMLQNDRRDDSDVAQLRRRVASSPGRFLKHTAGGGVARPPGPVPRAAAHARRAALGTGSSHLMAYPTGPRLADQL